MDSLNTTKTETEPGPSKKMKSNTDDSLSEDADDNLALPMTPANKLCEDELALIFSNSWISTKDLLNCRLMNKSWRDASTRILLQRDACYVTLGLDSKTLQNDNKSCTENPVKTCFYYFYQLGCKKGNQQNELSQLTTLISNSPKFPASSFHLKFSYDYYQIRNSTVYPDLLLFFKLHREKIKTLRLHGCLSQQHLIDILCIHTPCLECLDLSEELRMSMWTWTPEGDEDDIKETALKCISDVLPFKSLKLRRSVTANYRKIIHLLLTSPSNLNCIENVTLDSLEDILDAGKGHLIRSFKYKYSDTPNSLLMPKFLETYPKITSAIVDMVSSTRWIDALSLNALVESLQDTVENLELYFSYNNSFRNSLLQIPPMKNLKSIKLKGHYEAVGYGDQYAEQEPLRSIFFKFQDKIAAENYFPSLLKVRLNLLGGLLIEDNLMSFFKFDLDPNPNDTTTTECEWKWNHMPKVDIFEIDKNKSANHPCLEKRKPHLTIKNFPNVRVLKIKGGEVKDLASSWWALSQKVEFMEIYGLSPSEISDADCNDVDASLLVDKFFTGFSLGMCRKLRTTELMQEMNNPEMLKFLRLTPSVCDLQSLRELKLQFSARSKWSTEFASHVTVTYAFSKMPNTKFIISYDPKIFDRDTRWDSRGQAEAERTNNFEELCIGFMKPYVQIVHESN